MSSLNRQQDLTLVSRNCDSEDVIENGSHEGTYHLHCESAAWTQFCVLSQLKILHEEQSLADGVVAEESEIPW